MVLVEIAGARDHARELVVELEVDDGVAAGRHRFGQVELHDGVVRLRSRIGVHELPRHGLARLLHLAQLDPAVLALLQFDAGAEAAVALCFAHEGAAGALEGVEVDVQVQMRDGAVAAVEPGEALFSLDGVVVGVEDRLEVVVGDAQRAAPCRLFARRAHGSSRRSRDLDAVRIDGRRRRRAFRGSLRALFGGTGGPDCRKLRRRLGGQERQKQRDHRTVLLDGRRQWQ